MKCLSFIEKSQVFPGLFISFLVWFAQKINTESRGGTNNTEHGFTQPFTIASVWHKVIFFMWSTAFLNSEFYFLASCLIKAKEPSQPYYLVLVVLLLIVGKKNTWIHALTKGFIVYWNAKCFIQDLDTGCQCQQLLHLFERFVLFNQSHVPSVFTVLTVSKWLST